MSFVLFVVIFSLEESGSKDGNRVAKNFRLRVARDQQRYAISLRSFRSLIAFRLREERG